ncbi:hypothetical protein FNYG_08090 [Fusarium nygamai]|uniref:Condensation domain-containing protein n=1 Tax=Gibberella nygamai TaxID=42673 RepID=A0A2K0W8D6_GIBNY|nr:hypothetical protein FNYG_08090 [Fusarium nygamai]
MALTDILATLEGSELVLSLGYNARMGYRDRLQLLLQQSSPQFLPPSIQETDFPLLGTDDAGLKSLAAACEAKVRSWDPASIESIYPHSPLQQGIFVSKFKDPKAYVVYSAWKIGPVECLSKSNQQLKNAWRRLGRFHPVLRSVFSESRRSDGGLAPVLLRAGTPAAEPIITELH